MITTQIQSLKQQILRSSGLRWRLDFGNAIRPNSNSLELRDQTLAAGWHMIEASPDQHAIGLVVKLEAYTDCINKQRIGQQFIQLGNTRVAKRLIWLQRRCQSINVSVDTSIDIAAHISIELTRVTAAFARRRLRRATPEMVFPDVTTSEELTKRYQRYSLQLPIPDVASAYQQAYPGKKTLAATSLAACISTWGFADRFHIVNTELPHHDYKAELDRAPLLVLVSDKVSATAELKIALENIVNENNEDGSSTALWYTDHDHVTDSGRRVHPCFKPGWNKGLLHHGNYIGPLVLCTAQLYRQLGGLDLALGDSAIYEFLLKAACNIEESSVKHLPLVGFTLPAHTYHSPHGLYIGKKDRKVVTAYQQRDESQNISISHGAYPHIWNITRKPAEAQAQASVNILIPTRDHVKLLDQCISSILSISDYSNFKITVIDNNSSDPQTHAYHEKMSADRRYQKIDHPGEFNYSAINNQAASFSDADILILLNNDTEVLQADWMCRIVAELTQPDVGCVGVRLLYPNGLLQHAGIVTGLQGVAGHRYQFARPSDNGYGAAINLSADVTAVTGACLGIRRSVYQELGGLDAVNLGVAYNDVDLCLKARNAKYRNRYLADVSLIHHESVSRGVDNNKFKKIRFLEEVRYMERTHKHWIDNDPTWNSNFNRSFTTPALMDITQPCNIGSCTVSDKR